MATEKQYRMIDIAEPEVVQIQISQNRKVGTTVWINVDGICRLRATRVRKVQVDDDRS